MTDALAELRQRIREIEGRPTEGPVRAASGVAQLDASLGGLPCPGLVEVHGPVGSGRTRLVLAWAAEATRRGDRVAWVDPHDRLYPPTAAALGVSLDRLLLVRPPDPQLAWVADQLARSGCFGLVVLAEAPDLRGVARRWQDGVRQGRSTLVVLAERPCRALPADLRLAVQEGHAVVQRQRGGRIGEAVALPAWPEAIEPWDGGGGAPWG